MIEAKNSINIISLGEINEVFFFIYFGREIRDVKCWSVEEFIRRRTSYANLFHTRLSNGKFHKKKSMGFFLKGKKKKGKIKIANHNIRIEPIVSRY